MSCIDNDVWEKHNPLLLWIGWLWCGQCSLTHKCQHTRVFRRSAATDNTKSRGRRANSLSLSSRQIQFPSRTYVSWLKQPTKTGEICHILQDWTQYWVVLWHRDASLCYSLLSPDLSPSPNATISPASFLPSFWKKAQTSSTEMCLFSSACN